MCGHSTNTISFSSFLFTLLSVSLEQPRPTHRCPGNPPTSACDASDLLTSDLMPSDLMYSDTR